MRPVHLYVLAAIGLTACGSSVSTPGTSTSSGGAGGAGASGFGNPLSDECAAVATPLTSANAYDAAACEGLFESSDALVIVRPDPNGSLDAEGVSMAWTFIFSRQGDTVAHHVSIFNYDGSPASDVTAGSSLDEGCSAATAIGVLDSSVVVPDAVDRLPVGSNFENAFLEQESSCVQVYTFDEEHTVTIYHSPNAVSYAYYDAMGALLQFCGPCERGTPRGDCEPCSQ